MLIRIAAALLLTVATSAPAWSQTDCPDQRRAIETSLKRIAYTRWVDGLFDNSAPRAQVRQAEIANQLALVQINLAVMARMNCAPPPRAVSLGDEYTSAALDCASAQQKQKGAPGSPPPECLFSSWKPTEAAKP